jgi:hypothetical protein
MLARMPPHIRRLDIHRGLDQGVADRLCVIVQFAAVASGGRGQRSLSGPIGPDYIPAIRVTPAA